MEDITVADMIERHDDLEKVLLASGKKAEKQRDRIEKRLGAIEDRIKRLKKRSK